MLNSRKFQSALPRGERRERLCKSHRTHNFNPRSREGSDSFPFVISFATLNFNPRSREGSDLYTRFLCFLGDISIRAPARGATRPPAGMARDVMRFQSALPRGERQETAFVFSELIHFNPRSREGSDYGATATRPRSTYFNPRSREGSDRGTPTGRAIRWNFNPRSREGSDSTQTRSRWPTSYFNPRSREGSDSKQAADGTWYKISIRAPARGATAYLDTLESQAEFQSALPRGERQHRQATSKRFYVFQSALPRGERHQFSPKSSLLS